MAFEMEFLQNLIPIEEFTVSFQSLLTYYLKSLKIIEFDYQDLFQNTDNLEQELLYYLNLRLLAVPFVIVEVVVLASLQIFIEHEVDQLVLVWEEDDLVFVVVDAELEAVFEVLPY